MDDEDIINLLRSAPGQKATDLAVALRTDRRLVNQCLYGNLKHQVRQDETFRWYLVESVTGLPMEADEEDPEESEPNQSPERLPLQGTPPDGPGRIRSEGEASGTPAPFAFPSENELTPTWSEGDLPPIRFERALRLLIEDMQRNHTAAQSIQLQDGRRISFDVGEICFVFPWKGEEDIVEGATVFVRAGAQASPGRIIAVSPVGLTLQTDHDFGEQIESCTVRIDNTAMLMALADRMASIGGGLPGTEAANVASGRTNPKAPPAFHRELADSVITRGKVLSAKPIAPVAPDRELSARQEDAIQAALSQQVSFLWGPPGTGKTFVLSLIVKAFLNADQRTLICSNTNQAVDQLLGELCESLAGDPTDEVEAQRVLGSGQIIRVGKITEKGKLHPWGAWTSLEEVAIRRSAELQRQVEACEEQIRKYESDAANARRVVAKFEELDLAVVAEREAQKRDVEARKALSLAQARNSEARDAVAALETELATLENAGALRRVFLRSREKVDTDLLTSQLGLERALLASAGIVSAAGFAESEHTRTLQRVQRAKGSTEGERRDHAMTVIGRTEAEIGELRATISSHKRQIEAIKETVVRDAKIVGATATKAFLSPQMFAGFGAVIIDEASMLIVPSLYHAAGLAAERVIVSGDFRQLSPILQTREGCLRECLGRDVFSLVEIDRDFEAGCSVLPRTTMLDTQHRMDDSICQLISGRMYGGKLRTSERRTSASFAPAPFTFPSVIVDTSTLGPVTNKDARGSWYNLISALVVRNVCRQAAACSQDQNKDIGVVVPYAAQRKLLERILEDSALGNITAGTVHRYQGDEKRMIVVDLVEGLGRRYVGQWFSAADPGEEGCKLLNVAISRAREHLVFVGDLSWLDRKLPRRSMLREVLYKTQEEGGVIDARTILQASGVGEELRRVGIHLPEGIEAERTGLFNEREFFQVLPLDLARAERGIAIWSAFVTPEGVARLADLLRERASSGVQVRCVLPSPDRNGSIGEDAWHDCVRVLESAGVRIDIRAGMHEKAVLIDGRVSWVGSLNALSHSGSTRELMMRHDGRKTAMAIGAFFAAKPNATADGAGDTAYVVENPTCTSCGSRSKLVIARTGKRFWKCLRCGWGKDVLTGNEWGG